MSAQILSAQTADEIINRFLEVTGRKDGLKNVNSIYIKRSIYNRDTGVTSYLVSYIKRPDIVRLEWISASGEKTIRAYDGKKAWTAKYDPETDSLTGVKGIPPDTPLFIVFFKNVNIDNNFYGQFVDYSEKGSSAEFAGKETIDGKEMYHVKMFREKDHAVHYYFDASTGLIYKHWELDEQGRTHSSLYLDYRKAGDILIPFTHINTGPLRDDPEVVIEEKNLEVKMNIPLSDSLFIKPEKNNE